MNVLIACEYSGVVREEFRKLGHNAWSCDVLPTEIPGQHHQGDIKDFINTFKKGWDLMIAHPPCTYLSNSSVGHLFSKRVSTPETPYGVDRWKAMYDGAMFFDFLKNAPIPRICIENPIPHRYARGYIGKYTQIIQPWMFGHMESKATCLWLKNLPELQPTNCVKEEMMKLPNKERQKNHWTSPGKDRAKIRSKTYQGIARAMANQWG